MAEKERRGGILTNEDLENDLKVKGGGDASSRDHAGSQDTGDDKVRDLENRINESRNSPSEGDKNTSS